MIQTKNKFKIAAYIDESKENIIEKYNQDMPINALSKLYGVSKNILYLWLVKWGVTLRRYKGARQRKDDRLTARKHYKRAFSKAFLARQKENTRVNNERIKYVNFEHTTEDQKLVDNLLRLPIIG